MVESRISGPYAPKCCPASPAVVVAGKPAARAQPELEGAHAFDRAPTVSLRGVSWRLQVQLATRFDGPQPGRPRRSGPARSRDAHSSRCAFVSARTLRLDGRIGEEACGQRIRAHGASRVSRKGGQPLTRPQGRSSQVRPADHVCFRMPHRDRHRVLALTPRPRPPARRPSDTPSDTRRTARPAPRSGSALRASLGARPTPIRPIRHDPHQSHQPPSGGPLHAIEAGSLQTATPIGLSRSEWL
jgi:hypothetical protein